MDQVKKIKISLRNLSFIYCKDKKNKSLNSEDPDDEMQHDAAFHQGLHCL